jgi:hypothetical protein
MDLRTALSVALNKPINHPKPQPKVLNKTRRKGKHALKNYLGVVEYPISRGGGVGWLKSAVALRNYEDEGCKVVWL